MALGPKFQYLKTRLASFVIGNKWMDRHTVCHWLERIDRLTKRTYGETYQHLITTIMEAHSAFHAGYNAQCTKNLLPRGSEIMDKSVVVETALV